MLPNSPRNTLITRRTNFPPRSLLKVVWGLAWPPQPHSSLSGSQGRRRKGAASSWPQLQYSQGPFLMFSNPRHPPEVGQLLLMMLSRTQTLQAECCKPEGKLPFLPGAVSAPALHQHKPSCPGGGPTLPWAAELAWERWTMRPIVLTPSGPCESGEHQPTCSLVGRGLSFKKMRSIPSTFFLLPRLLLMAASSLRRLPFTICPVTGWINPAWRMPDKSMPREPWRVFTVPSLGMFVFRGKGEEFPGDPSEALDKSTAASRQPFSTMGG